MTSLTGAPSRPSRLPEGHRLRWFAVATLENENGIRNTEIIVMIVGSNVRKHASGQFEICRRRPNELTAIQPQEQSGQPWLVRLMAAI
jgi:hypothetical protein